MITAGITGGIGSGKTTFCRFWEEQGVDVLYLDDYAKELMILDEQVINDIRKTFGSESYNEDGSLNRAHLAAEAFQKGRVEELNNIVHPVLYRRIDELKKEKESRGTELFAIEAAILLNNGRPRYVDKVILIESDRSEQIRRVQERDGIDDESMITDRMNKQPDFSGLHHFADYVVRNDGTLAELKSEALEILQELIRAD